MFSIYKVLQILKKEIIQILRDVKLRALLIGPPVIQLIIFGYAVNMDVQNIRTAVVDCDDSVYSREFTAHLASNKYFVISEHFNNAEEVAPAIDSGKVVCAVVIERDFMKNIENGKTAAIQVIHDGTDSNTATMVINYTNVIAMSYAKGIQRDRIEKMNIKRSQTGAPPLKIGAIAIEPRTWFNETLESRNYFVPGLMGTIIMLITLMLTSMAIVREKEIGTMEQLMVTPVKPIEIILGKTLPFVFVGLFQALLILTVAVFWFGIPVKGSIALLLFGALIFIISCLGFGILISTISNTQQQAMLITSFFFLPAMTLSGFMFPINNMPYLVQLFTYLIPLRYFLIIIRGIVLKGVGLEVLYGQYLALIVISALIFIFSVKRFHKSID